jgi:hypothetical protein
MNGGPTETMLPDPGSPALVNGGTCTDPTTATPLTVDQRGFRRPSGNPCDIGAVQFQPPGAAGAPQIIGTPTVGQQLVCSQGAWTGDQLAFAFQWLRDGTPIAGQSSANYTVASNDSGDQLSCGVTGSNVKGTMRQTSAPLTMASSTGAEAGGAGTSGGGTPGGRSVALVLAAARETHKLWVEGNHLAKISGAGKNPTGTVFSFTLSETATVRFTFKLAVPGRKERLRCVAPNGRNRQRRACTRLVPAGSLSFIGHSGLNRVAFQGRLSRSKKLKLGSYTLLITATTDGQNSALQTLPFAIVKQ